MNGCAKRASAFAARFPYLCGGKGGAGGGGSSAGAGADVVVSSLDKLDMRYADSVARGDHSRMPPHRCRGNVDMIAVDATVDTCGAQREAANSLAKAEEYKVVLERDLLHVCQSFSWACICMLDCNCIDVRDWAHELRCM